MNILFPPTCWTTTSTKSKNSSFLLKPIPSLPTFWNYIAILVWFPLLFWFLASPLYPKEGAIADSLIGITKLLLLDQRTTISGIIQNCLGILFGLQRYGIFFDLFSNVLESNRVKIYPLYTVDYYNQLLYGYTHIPDIVSLSFLLIASDLSYRIVLFENVYILETEPFEDLQYQQYCQLFLEILSQYYDDTMVCSCLLSVLLIMEQLSN